MQTTKQRRCNQRYYSVHQRLHQACAAGCIVWVLEYTLEQHRLELYHSRRCEQQHSDENRVEIKTIKTS